MALMTLEFKLNGGNIVFLTYQEAELLYKDLEKIFGTPTTYIPPPVITYPPGVCDFNNDPRKIPQPYQPRCGTEHPREWTGQKEALEEIKLRGEAH